MTLSRIHPWSLSARTCCAFVLSFWLAAAALQPAVADEGKKPSKDLAHPAALDKPIPENVDDLKAIQQQVKAVLEKVVPCTVGLQVGGASGSGVIVTEDGYILTAGHVSGEPDKDVIVIMPDGKRLKGKSLGANNGIDSGMVKIVDEGKYPFVEMGNSKDVKNGQWCIAVGHPGGFKPGRSPVVRLGRILIHNDNLLTTDCTLVGGDSGGPLFDLDGKVIGIHSRIGLTINSNIHVPVDTYRETWDRLAKSEVWGGFKFGNTNGPWLGFTLDSDSKDCRVSEVVKDSPAAKAGVKVGDLLKKFDGKTIEKSDDLRSSLRKKKPGDEVEVEFARDKETVKLKLVVGKRPA